MGDRAGVIAGGKLIEIGRIDEIGGADARIPVVRWREHGVLHEERTTTLGELVARLGEPAHRQVIRPSLEDIHLALVGQHEASELEGAEQ